MHCECVCLLCVCVCMLVCLCVRVCVYKGVKTICFEQCLELKKMIICDNHDYLVRHRDNVSVWILMTYCIALLVCDVFCEISFFYY